MPSNSLTIRHSFQGGFATDFGPTANVSPDNAGQIQLPFLVDAENVLYEVDGGPHKIPGTAKLNSTEIESGEQIRGLFDYWRQGTGGTPTQRRVVHAGTKILNDNADGTFADLFTGLEDDKVPAYFSFDDFLVIASDSNTDVPRSWDQSTAQNLAGSPPNFAFGAKHQNRAWAAGVAANPSRLYYSALLDPEDWTGSGSGSIDIDPNDGDDIRAIASHKNQLWVFKGPYKGSIHRISGSAPTGSDAFARATFVEGLGAVGHNTVFRYRDDLGFMWADGSIHSLAATSAYGDFNETSLSRPIHQYIREHINFNRLKYAWATTNNDFGNVLFTVPIDASTNNNLIMMLDYRFSPMRWALWPAIAAGCLAAVIDPADSNRLITMGGGNDGFVRKLYRSDRSIDGTTAINAKVTTPHLDYGSPMIMKVFNQFGVGINPKGNYNFTYGWHRDNNAQQTGTLAQGGGDVLGVATANQFTLGTSTLSGGRFVNRYVEMEEGGEFRSIQYQFTQTANLEDLDIHSFTSVLSIGAMSTEN